MWRQGGQECGCRQGGPAGRATFPRGCAALVVACGNAVAEQHPVCGQASASLDDSPACRQSWVWVEASSAAAARVAIGVRTSPPGHSRWACAGWRRSITVLPDGALMDCSRLMASEASDAAVGTETGFRRQHRAAPPCRLVSLPEFLGNRSALHAMAWPTTHQVCRPPCRPPAGIDTRQQAAKMAAPRARAACCAAATTLLKAPRLA